MKSRTIQVLKMFVELEHGTAAQVCVLNNETIRKLWIVLGYEVAEVQSEFYNCCTATSLIGLGLKYIEIPKSLKKKILKNS